MPTGPFGVGETEEEHQIQALFDPRDGIEGYDDDFSRVVMSDGRVFTDTNHNGWFDSVVWHDSFQNWWHWDDGHWAPGWDPILPPPPNVGPLIIPDYVGG